MSRVISFIAIGIVATVAVYVRRLAIDVIGPGTFLFELAASSSIGGVGGEAWATSIYEAVAVWVPWLMVAAAVAGALYSEFRRTNVTAQR
jgi:hypothetical protein